MLRYDITKDFAVDAYVHFDYEDEIGLMTAQSVGITYRF
jgi:hypothetical protein